MDEHRILVVDDDQGVREQIRPLLEREGYAVSEAATGAHALEIARSQNPELIILDIQLSPADGAAMDGIEVLKRLREHSSVCVLMLTVTSLSYVKVSALELGADDYITKPFNNSELVARVKAILRRAKPAVPVENELIFEGLRIDVAACRVWKDEQEVELTPIEFDILLTLAQRPGQVFRRTQLINQAWDYHFMGDERLVDVHIGRLRKKIEESPANPKRIVTVWGKGYRFEPDHE